MRPIVGALVLGVLALLTAARLPAWESEETLWQAAVQTQPNNPRAAVNLATALFRTQQWTAACEALNHARTLLAQPASTQARTIALGVIANHALYAAYVGQPCD